MCAYLWHIVHTFIELMLLLLRVVNLLDLAHHFLVEVLLVASVSPRFHDALG